jgi:hypothetical protein
VVRAYCEREFKRVGDLARKNNVRLSFHPGQFTVLASESDDIVNRSIEEFEYLGFSFDGKNVYLKSSGLAKFYRKMKRSIKRSGFYAKYGKNKVPQLFKNRLYKRFTIVGAHRRQIVRKAPHLPNTFYRTNQYDWGNFITYAKLAENVFPNNKINKQIGSHWNNFHKSLGFGFSKVQLMHNVAKF